ncbi:cyclase family protein [Polyangium jinanense]|uniref:cyclase family protein n=1 Tax=Polyangium jinanense TaxID=2829994 RepID=UPI0023423A3E|nr:cyclase family protein [Polyangium jinanense]MDC3958784.1 cyclase family protein [Polyangium jinanense]
MRHAFLVPALIVLGGCAASRPLVDIDHSELVDLTYTFDEHTLYWPNAPSAFELQKLAYGRTQAGYFYAANAFCTPEHGGTHMDAPIHFAEGKMTAAEVPLARLIAPAVVIDVAAKAAENPDYRLTAADVLAWESRHEPITPGTIVLLRTGWGKRYPNRKAYFGDDTPGAIDKLHFPSYGEDAARLLIGERHVAAIGVDSASIDHGPSRDFIVHRIASEAEVPGFENLANLDRVPERGAWVIALPMKIAHGTGGPLRIVALLRK